MKQVTAIAAAFIITAIIAAGIFVIGVNAMTNAKGTPVKNSPNDPPAVQSGSGTVSDTSTNSTNVQQLQNEVSQYQQREQQYQAQLNQAAKQLTQANSQLQQDQQQIQQLQQYQQLVQALQQNGFITIDQNGNVTVGRASRGGGFFGGDDH